MSEPEFTLEVHLEAEGASETLRQVAWERLEALAAGRRDMVGASVAVEELAGVDRRHLFEASVVAYTRPEHVSAVGKAGSPEAALRQALDALERQILKARERRDKPWQRPGNVASRSVYELEAQEIYASFIDEADREDILSKSRTEIAAELMVQERLDEKAALFAAGRILEVAESKTRGGAAA